MLIEVLHLWHEIILEGLGASMCLPMVLSALLWIGGRFLLISPVRGTEAGAWDFGKEILLIFGCR